MGDAAISRVGDRVPAVQAIRTMYTYRLLEETSNIRGE